MSNELVRGVLVAAVFTHAVWPAQAPITITLASSAAGRKIELSADGGVTFFEPDEYDKTETELLVLSVLTPVTHIKFTGSVNDAWGVLS